MAARVKAARSSLVLSPNHLEVRAEGESARKAAPHSAAAARATSVLPDAWCKRGGGHAVRLGREAHKGPNSG